jgi:hypothetical protein
LTPHSFHEKPLHITLGQQNSTIELENQPQKCMTQGKIEAWKIQPFTQKLSHGTTLAIEEIYEVWKTQSLNRENQGSNSTNERRINQWKNWPLNHKINRRNAFPKEEFTNGKFTH